MKIVDLGEEYALDLAIKACPKCRGTGGLSPDPEGIWLFRVCSVCNEDRVRLDQLRKEIWNKKLDNAIRAAKLREC